MSVRLPKNDVTEILPMQQTRIIFTTIFFLFDKCKNHNNYNLRKNSG